MAKIRVDVVEAFGDHWDRSEVLLEAGTTVRGALAAAGRTHRGPVGIHGRRVSLETPLADGDRVEIYRPLPLDPRQARRRRARQRAR